MTSQPSSKAFLVVDDEPLWHRQTTLALKAFGNVRSAGSVGEAQRVVAGGSAWLGFIVDLVLPDGSGLEVIESVREQGLDGPVLVLTSHNDHHHIRRAHELRAEFICKAAELASLESFGRRCIAHFWTQSDRIALMIDELANAHRLTCREIELVAANVAGMPRRLVAQSLGVSENTVKAQTRHLLRKLQLDSLASVSDRILRQAIGGSALVQDVDRVQAAVVA
jgi:DNA-binding NarL/FixJ family response regulator